MDEEVKNSESWVSDIHRGFEDDTGQEVGREIVNAFLYPSREEKSAAGISVDDRTEEGRDGLAGRNKLPRSTEF